MDEGHNGILLHQFQSICMITFPHFVKYNIHSSHRFTRQTAKQADELHHGVTGFLFGILNYNFSVTNILQCLIFVTKSVCMSKYATVVLLRTSIAAVLSSRVI